MDLYMKYAIPCLFGLSLTVVGFLTNSIYCIISSMIITPIFCLLTLRQIKIDELNITTKTKRKRH